MLILSDHDKDRLKKMADDMGIFVGDQYFGPEAISSDSWFVEFMEKILEWLTELTPK